MRVEDAEEHCEKVQRLGAIHSPANQTCDRLLLPLRKQPGADSILDAQQQRVAEDQDVQPVLDERQSRPVEPRQQAGRKGYQRDREQESEVDPGVVAVCPLQLAQLGLLADPEDAEREKAHEVGDHRRRDVAQLVKEITFAVNSIHGRNRQSQHQEGHADRKDSVGDGGQPVEARPRQLVVVGVATPGLVHA